MVRKIIDGQLVSPPLTGKLLDGRYVTGYNKLPLEILKAEGWKAYSIINYTEELDESQIVKIERTETETEIIDRVVVINEN